MSLPSKAPAPGLGQPLRESVRVLGIYVRGQILLCLILAALYCAVFFWPVCVPYWYVIGIVGGAAAVVPRIGAFVPIGLAVLSLDFSAAPFKNYFIVLGLWLLVQAVEYFVLLPRLIGRPLGLKELPVLAALLLGSLVFGPLGLLFAVPVLAIGMVFWRYFRRRRAN